MSQLGRTFNIELNLTAKRNLTEGFGQIRQTTGRARRRGPVKLVSLFEIKMPYFDGGFLSQLPDKWSQVIGK